MDEAQAQDRSQTSYYVKCDVMTRVTEDATAQHSSTLTSGSNQAILWDAA